MSTFSFTVNIDPKDLSQLVAGGYVLGVQKSTVGASPAYPVQWLGIQLLAGTINVSYQVNYEVFFTSTVLDSGATIQQTSYALANMGSGWSYSAASSFTPAVLNNPPVNISSVGIQNNLGIYASYGLGLQATVNGQNRMAPLAVVPNLANLGQATFTPKENLIIYFSYQAVTDGCISAGLTTPQPISLLANVPQVWNYKNAQWTQGASPARAFVADEFPLYKALSTKPVRKFQLSLPFAIPTTVFETILASALKAPVGVSEVCGRDITFYVGGASKEDISKVKHAFELFSDNWTDGVVKKTYEIDLGHAHEEHSVETFLLNHTK